MAQVTKSSKQAAGNEVKLQTRAETSFQGRPSESYEVVLREDPRYFNQYGLSLVIKGTPGSWFLTTLLEHPTSRLYIDAGQEWLCTNMDEILREARRLVRPTYALRSASMTLRDQVRKLATEHPEMRKHLVPLLRKTAGRSSLIHYVIRVYPVHSGGYMTDAEWRPKEYGRPSDQNIKRYVETFNASLEPKGANSHLGRRWAIYGAEIIDQFEDKAVVAKWADRSIIQFYKNKPMFEVVAGCPDARTAAWSWES